jgi:AmiR/NasT family two-component response regulator
MNQQINGTNPKNAQALDTRAVVHQAAGMISAQLNVPIPTALQRLQAYAADHGRTVANVATDVVARRLHFEADTTH